MRGIEAAAKELHEMSIEQADTIDAARAVLAAWFVAEYGCQQCNGKGHLWWEYTESTTGQTLPADEACPAEHVELVNPFDGVVVYADVARCEWRCYVWSEWRKGGSDDRHPYCRPESEPPISELHDDCGWVPMPLSADAALGVEQ